MIVTPVESSDLEEILLERCEEVGGHVCREALGEARTYTFDAGRCAHLVGCTAADELPSGADPVTLSLAGILVRGVFWDICCTVLPVAWEEIDDVCRILRDIHAAREEVRYWSSTQSRESSLGEYARYWTRLHWHRSRGCTGITGEWIQGALAELSTASRAILRRSHGWELSTAGEKDYWDALCANARSGDVTGRRTLVWAERGRGGVHTLALMRGEVIASAEHSVLAEVDKALADAWNGAQMVAAGEVRLGAETARLACALLDTAYTDSGNEPSPEDIHDAIESAQCALARV